MTAIKVYRRTVGRHTEVKIFDGTDLNHLALVGRLMFTEEAAQVFIKALEIGFREVLMQKEGWCMPDEEGTYLYVDCEDESRSVELVSEVEEADDGR